MAANTVTQTSGPTIGSLTERAMLVDLTVSMWMAVKHDKRVSQEVADNHQSDSKMGRYLKNLVAPEALENLAKLRVKWAAEHRRRTLPWMDGGQRILSSAGYFAYMQKKAEFEREWDELVADFVAQYPRHYVEAQVRLNGLFRADDYPHPSRIADRFSAVTTFSNMPSAADFRVQLGEGETVRIKAEIERSTQDALAAAMENAWSRIKDVCERMVKRLSEYQVTPDGTKGRFNDTLVGNVKDLVDILPTLNVTESVELSVFTKRMRDELLKYDAQTLRESLVARKETADAAEKILKNVADFI